MRKYFLFAIFIWALLVNCSSESSRVQVTVPEKSVATEYTGINFVLVDSIMIDLAGELSVYDYNPHTHAFLAGDLVEGWKRPVQLSRHNKLGLVVIDSTGKVVNQFKKNGDGPEEFGRSALGRFFMSDSSVGVLGRRGLFEYTLNGRQLRKYSELNTIDYYGAEDDQLAVMSDYQTLFIAWEEVGDTQGRKGDSLFQLSKPFRVYDLNRVQTGTEKEEELLISKYGFPEHMIYAPNANYTQRSFNGLRTTQGSMPLIGYNRTTSEVNVVYPQLPVLERYDAKTGEFLSKVELNPRDFGAYVELGESSGGRKGQQTLMWWLKGGAMANSYYHDMIQLGAYTLFRYNPALPEGIVNEVVRIGSLSDYPQWARVRKKYYQFRYQLFKNGKKVVPDFVIPELEPEKGDVIFFKSFEINGKLIGGDGLNRVYVFVPNEGDVERDYELIRVYRLELVGN